MPEKKSITTEYIKLDQFLKFAGVVPTGGEAKELILSGLVAVNGVPCRQRGKKLRPGDAVMVKGSDYEVAAGEHQSD